VFVNLQGDAPLSPKFVVQQLVSRLDEDREASMATPVVRCSRALYEHLAADAAEGRVGGTTAVFSRSGRALYFSKRIIPHLPSGTDEDEAVPVYLHLGLYAYRPSALALYSKSPPSKLEVLEGLEQLRFLDLDLPISVVQLDPLDWAPIELNNPSDVAPIERTLAECGIE
jgi:3-deoxy-manno-octulosonate cytidylyltransferase (CMP-KDO synthetase)